MMTFRHLRNVVFCLLIAVLSLPLLVHAEYIDLKGGDVVDRGGCTKDEKAFVCVVVEKDSKQYLVLLDAKGEYEIYLMVKTGLVFLWARDAT